MTSMDRAKRFLAAKSRAIAITIVPLAGLIVSQTPAQAQGSLNPGDCRIAGINGVANISGNCTIGQESGVDSGGLLGVKLYSGTGDFEPVATTVLGNPSGGGIPYGLDIVAFGGTTGMDSFSGTIPVSWNFTPTSTSGPISYSLTFTLTPTPPSQLPLSVQNGLNSFSPITLTEGDLSSFTNPSGQAITLNDIFNVSFPTSFSSYSIELKVEAQSTAAGQQLSVFIPQNSIDFADSAAPEPGSIFLFGSGFAGLLFHRLRRARK